jgi:hypothetical protein
MNMLSGINYLLRRLHTYLIKEKDTISNILHNNEYDIKLISKLPPQKKQTKKIHKAIAEPKNEVSYLYIQQQRGKGSYKPFSRHRNKSGIP